MGTYGSKGRKYKPTGTPRQEKLKELGWKHKRTLKGYVATKTINGKLVTVTSKCFRSLFNRCIAKEV